MRNAICARTQASKQGRTLDEILGGGETNAVLPLFVVFPLFEMKCPQNFLFENYWGATTPPSPPLVSAPASKVPRSDESGPSVYLYSFCISSLYLYVYIFCISLYIYLLYIYSVSRANCKIGRTTQLQTSGTSRFSPSYPGKSGPIDVVFAIDGSSKTDPNRFVQMKNFLANIVSYLPVSRSEVHVGVVEYSDRHYIEINLDGYYDTSVHTPSHPVDKT